eukprot:s2167_g11.t1
MLCDCSCFDVGSTNCPGIRAPDHRAMPAEMTEVDYNPDVQTEVHPVTEVPPVPAGTPIVVEETPKETEEPVTPVPAASSVKPKVKAMPKKTIGKRKGTAAKPKAVAVKKMPRPAVKKVKQEASESGKNVRGTFHIRQAENNRKRRLAWKARQRDAMAYFKKKRQEEESRPAEIIAVERSGHGREIHRKVFNPASGKREVMNITVGERSTEGGNTKKLITSFKGFSRRPVDELRCGHCGEVGHIISMCPQMSRRVSLTQGAVVLTPRTGIYETATLSETGVEDTIRPDDSISTVAANLLAESLRAHNRRLRGWKPTQAMPAPPPAPPTPPPIPAPLPPPATPPPKEKPMHSGGAPAARPPVKAPPTAAPKGTTGKSAGAAPATPPKRTSGKAASPAASPAKSSPAAEAPPPKLRTGPGGTLEVASSVGNASGGHGDPIPAPTPAVEPKAMSITAVSPAGSVGPKSASGVGTVGLPERLQSCIACHGTGTLPMRVNRRLSARSAAAISTDRAADPGGKFIKEHEKIFFSLLDAVEKILSRLQKQTKQTGSTVILTAGGAFEAFEGTLRCLRSLRRYLKRATKASKASKEKKRRGREEKRKRKGREEEEKRKRRGREEEEKRKRRGREEEEKRKRRGREEEEKRKRRGREEAEKRKRRGREEEEKRQRRGRE